VTAVETGKETPKAAKNIRHAKTKTANDGDKPQNRQQQRDNRSDDGRRNGRERMNRLGATTKNLKASIHEQHYI
jgi:hypothetical protein